MGPDDLILTNGAMVSVEPPATFIGRSFEDRCIAAAAGGFAGVGLSLEHYRLEREIGHSDADLVAMQRAYGVSFNQIEALIFPGAQDLPSFWSDLEAALAMGDALGADQAYVVGGDGVAIEDHVATFGQVADRCAAHGVTVGLEFVDLPGVTAIRDARTALDVVLRAQRPNAGVTIDTYHFYNGPNTWDDLEAIPAELVVMIQFSDGAVPREADDYLTDTLHNRCLPGDGDYDLERFVRLMDTKGVACAYSVEVFDDELMYRDAAEVGRLLGASTRAVLEASRR